MQHIKTFAYFLAYTLLYTKLKKMNLLLPLSRMLICLLLVSCTEQNLPYYQQQQPVLVKKTYRYMALGDSYTIGQSVCENCRFPAQLETQLQNNLPKADINTDIIAATGWTTTNLINTIGTRNPASKYDLVTLLIGVNNQYQHKPFALYETEFPRLVNTAIALAKGDKNSVIVVSIPDYAYTPFGQGSESISTEIAQYNAFAQNYCAVNQIEFVNITDITQLGLVQPELVASDGLHPSELAYSKFVERLLPKAKAILSQ